MVTNGLLPHHSRQHPSLMPPFPHLPSRLLPHQPSPHPRHHHPLPHPRPHPRPALPRVIEPTLSLHTHGITHSGILPSCLPSPPSAILTVPPTHPLSHRLSRTPFLHPLSNPRPSLLHADGAAACCCCPCLSAPVSLPLSLCPCLSAPVSLSLSLCPCLSAPVSLPLSLCPCLSAPVTLSLFLCPRLSEGEGPPSDVWALGCLALAIATGA
ncbi:unnamed protein product [Closterium sp. Naga37s-1]|nr:unnamed protein product [Closterium sp. Naga37s-1]